MPIRPDGYFTRGAGGQHHGNLDPLAGSQGEALSQAKDRIQDKALAASGFLKGPHRIGKRAAATDETAAVGFEAQGSIRGSSGSRIQRKSMRDIDGRLAAAAQPAPGQKRPLLG